MVVLERLDVIASPWDNVADKEQSEDKDSDASTEIIPGSNGISGILEGHPSPVNDAPPANMDEAMSDKFFAGVRDG